MKRLFTLTALVLALAGMSVAASTATAAPPPSATANLTQQINQTVGGFPVTGTATIQEFVNQGDGLAALVDFVGNVNVLGVLLPINLNDVLVPVTGAEAPGATCKILDLTLGPLDLDLLGLVVQLDTVHLEITAVPGPGNLLGNLLCAIAGLFDGNNDGILARLLNQLLGL